eukprot:5936155-Pyramimonas_sp.AAC.1
MAREKRICPLRHRRQGTNIEPLSGNVAKPPSPPPAPAPKAVAELREASWTSTRNPMAPPPGIRDSPPPPKWTSTLGEGPSCESRRIGR